MTLSEQDNGRTVGPGASEVVTIRLKENPTTGYRWAIENAGQMELIDDQFEVGGEAVGAAGTRVLQFRASRAGSHQLRLKNRREWEGDSSIIERFEATIVAK